ncbi:MAG TPA: 2-C-methyl-D-erythritol 4-phosphate cytidylyltransferase [Dehalococcoidia bacterium]|nr:2-C-methyl-D-erythritol 4-phosphate cytidylyltransferase [Dehalococcoidia bacterium]
MGGNGVVIVGAGSSTRMGGIDKVFAPLAGLPLVAHALLAATRCREVQYIVLVVAGDRLAEVRTSLPAAALGKLVAVVAGGARRQDSVVAGLAALPETGYVAIHDAARPIVTSDLFSAGFAAARETGAAIAAVPVVDTLKRAALDGTIVETVPRERLWAVQTPQVFRSGLLIAAHRAAAGDVTDDAMLVEALGHPVHVFAGSPANLKVTTPDDLVVAEALIAARSR